MKKGIIKRKACICKNNLKYNIDIQADYLSKIYNSYSKEISESKYGIELNKIINK